MQQGKKRIIFVNRFFYPDISATAQILGELTFALAKNNTAITVITSRSAYDDTAVNFPDAETIDGVEVIRVGRNRFKRTNYFGRLADLVVFYVLLSFKLLGIVSRSDVLVCKTDPPMLLVLGGCIKRIKKCHLISWNQDLFPEVAAAYFKRFPLNLIYPPLKFLRDRSLRYCDQCVVISDAMRLQLRDLGVDRIEVISNWGKHVNADLYKVTELKKKWTIDDRFIVEYSGNFGFVHDYETIKDVIELLRLNTTIVFLFIGSGKHYEALRDHVKTQQLENVVFKPYQPVERLSDSLSLADLHLITFNPAMEGLVFPSKFYSICAAARPVLYIGGRYTELATIISENNCGHSFDPGQSQQIVDYLINASSRPQELTLQGENARELFLKHYTLSHAQIKWATVLNLSA